MFSTEMTPETIPGWRWLGWLDSREYLGDGDGDYCLKHFHTFIEDNELMLRITNETSGSFFSQAEGECNWPCLTEKNRVTLEKILIKSLGDLQRPIQNKGR